MVHETQILKPKSPTIEDNNDWPDFTLTNAEVWDADGNEHVSLLTASDRRPLKVKGKLAKLAPNRTRYLLPKASLPVTLEVTNVQEFSYGQYEEGEGALWAAGEAGWFEIKPSKKYKAIFSSMTEAVDMMYFTADFFRQNKRKKASIGLVDQLFQKYADDPSHNCRSTTQATELFHKHRSFLLSCMREGKEGINWKATPIYQYLVKEKSETTSAEELEYASIRTPINDDKLSTRPAGKGKSSLRLPSGKGSMKAAARREALVDAMEVDDPQSGTASPLKRKSSHGPSQRLRKRLHLDDQSEENTVQASSSEGENGPEPSLPLRSTIPKHLPKREPVLKVIEEPLPSYGAKGPGDTWICDFDGCAHKVYAASTTRSRERIKEHYRTHAVESQNQLDLVMKEERPYLPVSNLVKKIRDLAAQHRSLPIKDDGRSMFPKPIERAQY